MALNDFSIRLLNKVTLPYLTLPPNNRGISFNKSPRFVLSNQMLDAKIKQLKKDGLQNTTHKPAIEQEKLKNGEVLSLTQPLSSTETCLVPHFFLLVPPWF